MATQGTNPSSTISGAAERMAILETELQEALESNKLLKEQLRSRWACCFLHLKDSRQGSTHMAWGCALGAAAFPGGGVECRLHPAAN